MNSLPANPSGSYGIYGQGGQSAQPDVLGIVNNLKDREMRDFRDKAQFMSDLSIKQDRLRRLYGLDGGKSLDQQESQQGQQPMNTVTGVDPNQMTGYQKADIGIKQQGMNLDSQKMAQASRMGEESLGIKSQQEQLNQQKSDQINAGKQADMQRKIDDSAQKIEMAQQALNSKNTNAESQLQAHKDMAAAVEERHKLEMAQKDQAFEDSKQLHAAQIKNMQDKLDQSGNTSTDKTIQYDKNGNPIGETTSTRRGSGSGNNDPAGIR